MQAQCASEIFVAEQKHLPVICRPMTQKKLKKALYYFGIILFFGLGDGIGGNLSIRFGYHMIWVSSGLLLISFLLMFVGKDGPVNSSERYRRGFYADKIHVKDTVVVPICRKFNI